MAATNLTRPVVNGVPLITIEEASKLIGLSVWRIRERVCDRATRRGGFIRSHKFSTRRYFNQDELLEDVYGAGNGVSGTTQDDEDYPV